MDIQTAHAAAGQPADFTLPELVRAQTMLEAGGFTAEALTVEEYLIDQSDEAWEACDITPD